MAGWEGEGACRVRGWVYVPFSYSIAENWQVFQNNWGGDAYSKHSLMVAMYPPPIKYSLPIITGVAELVWLVQLGRTTFILRPAHAVVVWRPTPSCNEYTAS